MKMIGAVKKVIRSQKGQALPAVLALLALGGLTISASLDYVSTSLRGNNMIAERVRGIYAAEAGIEDAFWCLKNSTTPPTQLTESINGMTVDILTENKGEYTLYLGELIEPGGHNDYLDVAGDIVWDDSAGRFKYTITITLQVNETIHLEEVGARLPIGYSYDPGSSANFTENLSYAEPEESQDSQNNYLLNWVFSTPYPSVSQSEPVETQSFYIIGSGPQEGHYAWALANREDVGAVGEITGTLYRITAAARRPGDNRTAARLVIDGMLEGGSITITSWRIER
jgi:hypothetical protein